MGGRDSRPPAAGLRPPRLRDLGRLPPGGDALARARPRDPRRNGAERGHNRRRKGLVGAETSPVSRPRLVFAAIAVGVFALDRVTKYLVVSTIPSDTERGPIAGVLWIQHLQNSCAAFSLCGPSQVAFLVISIVVAVAIVVYALQQ
ncbi:MAG: hypothetical protein E6J29_10145, partial [Chloroflexi bacterium]